MGAAAIRLADLEATLTDVDLLLTGHRRGIEMMLEHGDLARIMATHDGRPLLVVERRGASATSTPPPAQSAGVTLSTWTTCGPSPSPGSASAADARSAPYAT